MPNSSRVCSPASPASTSRSSFTVNLERSRQLEVYQGRGSPFVLRMEDGKRHAYNQLLARCIFEVLPQTETWEKYQERLSDVLNLGLKAA